MIDSSPKQDCFIGISAEQCVLADDIGLQYLLYGFYTAYRHDSSTYQGTILYQNLEVDDCKNLLSIFDSAIIEERENSFAVTAQLSNGSEKAHTAFEAFYKSDKLNPFITSFVKASKGLANEFGNFFRYRSDDSVPAISAEELRFIEFLRMQLDLTGYMMIPLPGLRTKDITENEIFPKLLNIGNSEIYFVSRFGEFYSQYILLLKKR